MPIGNYSFLQIEVGELLKPPTDAIVLPFDPTNSIQGSEHEDITKKTPFFHYRLYHELSRAERKKRTIPDGMQLYIPGFNVIPGVIFVIDRFTLSISQLVLATLIGTTPHGLRSITLPVFRSRLPYTITHQTLDSITEEFMRAVFEYENQYRGTSKMIITIVAHNSDVFNRLRNYI